MKEIRITQVIKIPRLPNYIRFGAGEGHYYDVANIDDGTLKEIGEEWTRLLIEHAKRRRADSNESKGEKFK